MKICDNRILFLFENEIIRISIFFFILLIFNSRSSNWSNDQIVINENKLLKPMNRENIQN